MEVIENLIPTVQLVQKWFIYMPLSHSDPSLQLSIFYWQLLIQPVLNVNNGPVQICRYGGRTIATKNHRVRKRGKLLVTFPIIKNFENRGFKNSWFYCIKIGLILGVRTCNTYQWCKTKKTKKSTNKLTLILKIAKETKKNFPGFYTEVKQIMAAFALVA